MSVYTLLKAHTQLNMLATLTEGIPDTPGYATTYQVDRYHLKKDGTLNHLGANGSTCRADFDGKDWWHIPER